MGIVLVLLAVAGTGAWLAYRNSALLHICQEMDREVAHVAGVARQTLEAREGPSEEFREQAARYVHAQRESMRERIPLESLRELVDGRVQWSALRGAGYSTLSQLARANETQLLRIKGVGPATATRILEAARSVERQVGSRPVRLPGPRVAAPGEAALVGAALLASDARELLGEHPEALRRQHQALRMQAQKVRSQASFFHWLFVATGGLEKSAVYRAARHCRDAVAAVLGGEDVRAAETAIRTLSHRADVQADPGLLAARFNERRDRILKLIADCIGGPVTVGDASGGLAPRATAAVDRTSTSIPGRAPPGVRTADPPGGADRVLPSVPEVPAGGEARIPDREVRPPGAWVPAGSAIKVRGYTIPGGMVYVGTQLGSPSTPSEPDPALIDPRLPVDQHVPDWDGEEMSYWPSYSRISAACRAAYLHWLSGGRCDSNTYIGYVFLFFYGLERRVLHDAQVGSVPDSEVDTLRKEVERLLGLYGQNSSFHGYACGLLGLLDLRHQMAIVPAEPPEPSERHWELPMALRLGLGRLVSQGRPVPAAWARAWVLQHPDTYLRTAATRCRKKFEQLFDMKYREAFGEGMVLKPNRRKLSVSYRPASAGFQGRTIETPTGLPDVGSLGKPVRELRGIVTACTEELDPYSRYLGRHPEESGSMSALALLPGPLLAQSDDARIQALKGRLQSATRSGEVAVAQVEQIFEGFGPASPGPLSKRESVQRAQLLQALGFGVEPDVRFGSPRMPAAGSVVIFHVPVGGGASACEDHAATAVLVHLSAAVAAADGDVSEQEEELLERHIQTATRLKAGERLRLRAYLKWSLIAPPSLSGLARRLRSLDPAQRETAGRFLVGVACADGRVDPGEIKVLTKLYRLLELDPAQVHREIHAVASGAEAAPTEPVTVRPGTGGPGGFAIPHEPGPPSTGGAEAGAVVLDMDLVRRREVETAAVARRLAAILVEDEERVPPTLDAAPAQTIGMLDAPHSALLRALGEKPQWSRGEYEDLAAGLHLLPEGAIDVLNEAALEEVDDIVLDGEDPLCVNMDVIEEMLP